MWSCHHDWDSQRLQEFQWSFSRVVSSSVKCPDCWLAPIGSFFVQFQDKRFPKYAHHTFIGVRLCKSDVWVSKRIDSSQHRHSRCYLECSHRVLRIRKLPLHPSEVTHPQPCFIQIANNNVFQILFQILDGPLLSQNQTSLRIRRQCYMLNFLVPHT